MMTLYDYYRSSACFRVRIALNLKKISHETITIHLLNNGGEQHSDTYKKINPLATVPALMIDHQPIVESLAIIEYLEETHPTPALLPQNPYQRALVRSFALMIASDIHPLNNLRVTNYLSQTLNITNDEKTAWYQHWINTGLIALETQLSTFNKGQPFCFGETPSLADCCLVPQLFNARRFSCDLTPYPTLVRIDAHCQKEPAFTHAWPMEATA